MNFIKNKWFGVLGIVFIVVVIIAGSNSRSNNSEQIVEIVEQDLDVSTSSTNIGEEFFENKKDSSAVVFLEKEDADKIEVADSGKREIITFAGGCFWCIEAFFQEEKGVVDAINGYAGGDSKDANYLIVSKGRTEHREAVQVTFDPERVSLERVIDIFWTQIDPTDSGGQFADRGFQYTTAIFYHTENQKILAEESKKKLEESGLFDKPIVTKILPYSTFFEAEEYHQDYYKKASEHYQRYAKASGRKGFIEDNWAKQAAIEFLESQ